MVIPGVKALNPVEGRVVVIALIQNGSDSYVTAAFLTNSSGGNVVYKGLVKLIEIEDLGKNVRIKVQLNLTDAEPYLENLVKMDFLNEKALRRVIFMDFLVDKEDNTFNMNGTRVLFPFLLVEENVKPFHIFEPLRKEKLNVVGSDVVDATKFYSPRTFSYTFCSGSIGTRNVTCDPSIKLNYADIIAKSNYVIEANLFFPNDPFGIYNGPVLLSFQINSSELNEPLMENGQNWGPYLVVFLFFLLGIGAFKMKR